MEKKLNSCYVVDKYNKFDRNDNVVYKTLLEIGGRTTPYCIREIPIKEYNWGQIIPAEWEQQRIDEDYSYQKTYSSFADAKAFIRELGGI